MLIGVEYFLQGCLALLKTEALTVSFLGHYNGVQNFSILKRVLFLLGSHFVVFLIISIVILL